MEVQLTRNDLKKLGERCIRLPYGDPVLYGCRRRGWNYGLYGWNWTAYTVEGFDGTLIEGYRSFPRGAITPTPDELEVIHKAYKHGPNALIKALETVQGRNKDD